MKEKVTILFGEEVPDIRFTPNTYTKLPAEKAYQYMIDGYGVEYDPKTREKNDPILDDDFPGRDKLFSEGLYTFEKVKDNLGSLKDIDGIGPKTFSDIKDKFSAKRVMGIHEKAKTGKED